MKKKLLSLFLILAMVLTLLPTAALAAEDEKYSITVNKLQVTEKDGKLDVHPSCYGPGHSANACGR